MRSWPPQSWVYQIQIWKYSEWSLYRHWGISAPVATSHCRSNDSGSDGSDSSDGSDGSDGSDDDGSEGSDGNDDINGSDGIHGSDGDDDDKIGQYMSL